MQSPIEGNSKAISTFCGVCSLPSNSVRCGVISCDSCKKFFLRHRSKLDSFTCVTGRGDCVRVNQLSATHLNFSNREQYCVRCRLVRCFQIGMRVKNGAKRTTSTGDDDSSKQSPPPMADEMSPKNDSVIEKEQSPCTALAISTNCRESITTAEETMKMAMVAVASLSASFQSMPWTLNPTNCPTDSAMWRYTMDNFSYLVSAAVDYVKKLQEFCRLSMSDRCRLFSQALVPLLAVQVTVPGRDSSLLFFGMPPQLRHTFMHFFPTYKALEADLEEISAIMHVWKPSFIECALLQAMIVFRTDCLSKLTDPQLVCRANQQLCSTLDSYLMSSTDEPELRKYYFMRVYEALLTTFQGTYESIITRLSYNRPDLMHGNRLFADMYNLPNAVDCERQYRVLNGPSLATFLDEQEQNEQLF